MGFVCEKVGKQNEAIWNAIGWKNWDDIIKSAKEAFLVCDFTNGRVN